MIKREWNLQLGRIALANYTEIIEGRSTPGGGVFLDISHKEKIA